MAHAALSGATVGSLAALGLVGALWLGHVGPSRGFALLACGAGGLAGALVRARRRWSETHVALFLDARLGEAELVTSAVGCGNDSSEVAESLRTRAERSLQSFAPKKLGLAPWARWHALLVPALGLALWVAWLPTRVAVAATPKGSKLVQRTDVPGLERIEALSSAPSLSPADNERLKRLAEEARRLRADLAKGLTEREAQARIAALREGIGEERERFSDRTERAGLEAAIAALEAAPGGKRLAKALGDGDLVTFDEEMQRLANQAESESRQAVQRALEDASRAAREKNAQKLAEMLDRKRKDFREREANARFLREFAKQLENKLPPDAKADLNQLDQSGDPEAARRLAEALGAALKGLSDEERERLTEALKSKMSDPNGELSSMNPDEMRRLVDSLKSRDAQKKLADALRDLAKKGAESERDQALDDAERGGAEAERSLGASPLPLPTPGSGDASGSPSQGSGNGKDPSPSGQGGPGGSGKAPASAHSGSTPEIAGNELRSRANARWLPGAPLAARSLGRAPGRAGETANQVGVGNLSSRASSEVNAIDGADIPEEYREHVGRYFEP